MAGPLDPSISSKVNAIIAEMAKRGYDVHVVSTTRTPDQQKKLYAKGRSEPGSIVTEKSGAPGDESLHQSGLAADFAFSGKANWKLFGQVAKQQGLEWGGDWDTLKDYGHVQGAKPGPRYPLDSTTYPEMGQLPSSSSQLTSQESKPPSEVGQLATMLSGAPPSESKPMMTPDEPQVVSPHQVGDIKTFSNGNKGRWDGQGWEDVTGSPHGDTVRAQPPSTPAHATPTADRSLTNTLLTDVAAPAAGYAIGGMAAGPVGAGVGSVAGKGYGQLYNYLTSPDTHLGHDLYSAATNPGEFVAGAGEAAGVDALEGGAATLGGKALSYLKYVPVPARTAINAGIGGLAGRQIGGMMGHPTSGAAIGAATPFLGAAAARGIGKLADSLITPLDEKAAQSATQDALSQGVHPKSAAALGANADANHWMNKEVGTVQGIKDYLFGGAKAAPVEANPLPNGGPESSPPSLTLTPPMASSNAKDLMRDVPGVGGYKYARPDFSRTPSRVVSADVETTGDWNPQPVASHPQEAPWSEHVEHSNPKRSSAKSFGSVEVSSPFDKPPAYKNPATTPQGDALFNSVFNSGPAPSTVSDAKGLSAAEQQLWNAYHEAHPEVGIDEWYSKISRMAPNEGADLSEMAKRLAKSLGLDRIREDQ